jgi:GTP diphosphokinase / guanosine-3',5'-bis(diphosphate) 3'-diphosphatase
MDYPRFYKHLHDILSRQLGNEDLDQVERAYRVAEGAHTGQMRDEGTPYIIHPLRVAISLAEEVQVYSPRLICSALMHDVIEDSEITRAEIADMFGDEIAHIVWLLTKFEEVGLGAYLGAIEAAADTGAPIVKLCDRLDNLRFLAHSPKVEKKRRYIRTTEEHYLPLARRTSSYLFDQLVRWLDEARNHLRSIEQSGQKGQGE